MTISLIALGPSYAGKQASREALAEEGYAIDLAPHAEALAQIPTLPLAEIFERLCRRDLTADEAFVGMCYALRATNAAFARVTEELFTGIDCDFRLAGREFLSCMAVKEAHARLTPAEIAGMVRATSLDLVIRPQFASSVIEVCGTGGDIGFMRGGFRRKTINASTLSTLVLASLGVPTLKHGSYANTSAVGSTDALEAFGGRVEQDSTAAIRELFAQCNYYFADAHVVKTVHDLSHMQPRHETVNHVLGPMTPPVARDCLLHKVMGVNEKVHPRTIAQAFELMDRLGVQRIGNVAVVAGLDAPIDFLRSEEDRYVRDHIMLDELSPLVSIVAFCRKGRYLGCGLLRPEDFGTHFADGAVELENTRSVIQRANERALAGLDPVGSDYLAMNAALALFVACYLDRPDAYSEESGPNRDMLQECFRRCRGAIHEVRPHEFLRRYVTATGGTFKSTLEGGV